VKSILDVLFVRDRHVCPWWCCFTFDNPIRRLFHDPVRILSSYLGPGSTAIDIGPGMGFFTVAMCGLVGDSGRVIAVDVQERMLESLSRRVRRHNLGDRLETHVATSEALGIASRADFILAFWMVHEVPDQGHFLEEVAGLLKPGGSFLLAEPYLHVTGKAFNKTLDAASRAGLRVTASPRIAFSRTALFHKESTVAAGIAAG
jgi:ubiquinone/menaquinone biosynthesis C-methylase UbiE